MPRVEGTDEAEKAAAIQDVVQHAARITRAVALAKPMESYRSRPIVLAALAVPLLLLSVYSYVARPDWVYGPDPARRPLAEREAHLRYTLFLVAQRLATYRDANGGQLPRSLSEIGEEWPGVAYVNVGGAGFELRAQADSARAIVLRSDEDPRAFLGASRGFLREASP